MVSPAAAAVLAAFVFAPCLLLPAVVTAAVQAPEVVAANADAKDAFAADAAWELPPGLINVDLENFENTVQHHELSVMVFFTKFSPYHRYAQRVLSNVSLEFEARNDVPGVAFCAVDLDKTPELSTYTHFNSIDVMFFFPHLILNGVRYPGNLTAEALMNHTYHMYQRSTAHLLTLNQPFSDAKMKQLVGHFIKPDAGTEHTVKSLEMHLQQHKDMLDALVAVNEDTGALAKESNTHVQTVLRFDGRDHKVDRFLEARRLTEVYANFLEHLYERRQVPQATQATSSMHSAAAGKKKKRELMPEAAAAEEELM